MKTTEHLLEEFPAASTAEWEAVIARDLKGSDYEKKLIWRSEDGLTVKPYYRAADLKNLACLDSAPGEFPYRRGTRTTGGWQIRELIDAAIPEDTNLAARAAVVAGADAISFSKALPRSAADLDVLLADLGEIPIHFERADERLILQLCERLAERRSGTVISTGYDALANTVFTATVIKKLPAGFVPFTIDAVEFEESGATAVEEIGLALAAGVDFLAAIQERGIDADRAAASIEYAFAIGSDYFFQIAKLRAFRMVWARVAERFGATAAGARARIAARPSRWNKTAYDPYVNALRATTEAMAAILGGADAVTVEAFDSCYKEPDEASRRLARNTQLLLRHEAWLGQIADPAGGSYYVEAMTDLLAQEGWKKMQEVEGHGGYRAAQTDGFVAETLARSLAAREAAATQRRRVFIGSNQFANPAERALERADKQRLKRMRRATRPYEDLRLRTERYLAAGGRMPRILLAEIGDAKMRTARAGFAANFFACSGLATETKRFKRSEEIAAEECDMIVLCSSDAEYGPLAAELLPQMRVHDRSTLVIVAGNPDNAGDLAAMGIADFVHLRSHPVETLTKWQMRLGIED